VKLAFIYLVNSAVTKERPLAHVEGKYMERCTKKQAAGNPVQTAVTACNSGQTVTQVGLNELSEAPALGENMY